MQQRIQMNHWLLQSVVSLTHVETRRRFALKGCFVPTALSMHNTSLGDWTALCIVLCVFWSEANNHKRGEGCLNPSSTWGTEIWRQHFHFPRRRKTYRAALQTFTLQRTITNVRRLLRCHWGYCLWAAGLHHQDSKTIKIHLDFC